jgi:peptidoglycan/LPS O-acetylase OafA/YrhL
MNLNNLTISEKARYDYYRGLFWIIPLPILSFAFIILLSYFILGEVNLVSFILGILMLFMGVLLSYSGCNLLINIRKAGF